MTYEIKVVRGENQGTLSFKSGSISVSTPCWWAPKVKIEAGTYAGYATWMANKTDGSATDQDCPWLNAKKRRVGIFLGKGVPVANSTSHLDGIFIHKGTSAKESDGCIVADGNEVLKIWNAITPKDSQNVTVIVEDQKPAASPLPLGRNKGYNPLLMCRFSFPPM